MNPGCVDTWLDSGIPADALAVLLREPGAGVLHLRDGVLNGRFRGVWERCRERGVRLILGLDFGDLDQGCKVLDELFLDGIQLRGDPDAEDLAAARARSPRGLLGRSVHGAVPSEAASAPVDFTVFAPVFAPRTSGPVAKVPAGVEALRAWCAACPTPVLALGGVTQERAADCLAAGARGLASISAFFGPVDRVAQEAAGLWRALQEHDGPS